MAPKRGEPALWIGMVLLGMLVLLGIGGLASAGYRKQKKH